METYDYDVCMYMYYVLVEDKIINIIKAEGKVNVEYLASITAPLRYK